jgi:hypothetical protein
MAGRVCLIDAPAKNEGSEAADPNVRFGSIVLKKSEGKFCAQFPV